ncbi:uncharacterized protein LOC117644769 [Thrips palmi]|uniref:Uncharacterized protein LOC117644769 n=1 Tax=Thrips palmi TaxID=161013 RepID=A0A6P8YT52_THRPL|nr:uncharacterized protein LOC117644769 [Thrips palmi]
MRLEAVLLFLPPDITVSKTTFQMAALRTTEISGETFSAHHSARAACLLCSRCGAGLFVAKECTLTHDTVCAACHPPPPLHRRNEDYALRCSRNVPREDDDEYVLGDAPADDRQDGPGHHVHGGLASYGLSQSSLPPRSKSDMARSILADPGAVEKTSLATGASTASTTRGRLPHVLLADDDDVPEEYSLLQRQHAQAGPAYSVLTDDGPVLVAPNRHAAKAKAATAATPRPPPPRYVASPLRISSPALPASWGRPSAPSLNTRQTRLGMPPRPASSSDLALPLRHHTDDGDMNAEEVGRLML